MKNKWKSKIFVNLWKENCVGGLRFFFELFHERAKDFVEGDRPLDQPIEVGGQARFIIDVCILFSLHDATGLLRFDRFFCRSLAMPPADLDLTANETGRNLQQHAETLHNGT